MSGEKSKSSGEYGEKITSELLKLIGWKDTFNGKDIPCVKNDIHKGEAGNPRKKHGIDSVVQYECPLMSRLQKDILISIKHRQDYPKAVQGITTKFKSYLKDIAEATECYPAHELYRRRIRGTKRIDISNIIMWFNSANGKENEGVINELQNFRNNEKINYRSVYLIDNKKANFLFSAIKYVQSKSDVFFFYYPDTGFNMDTSERSHQGHILPIQFINSPILLFKITESSGSTLIIVSEDNFSAEYLDRLFQLSRLITANWASKIIIAFSDYNNYENENDVKKSKSKIRDSDFAEQIFIEKFSYLDFRNLGGDS